MPCYTILLCASTPLRGLDTYVIAMISHCGWGLVANACAFEAVCVGLSLSLSLSPERVCAYVQQKRTPCRKSFAPRGKAFALFRGDDDGRLSRPEKILLEKKKKRKKQRGDRSR